jgi:hypothetical protein
MTLTPALSSSPGNCSCDASRSHQVMRCLSVTPGHRTKTIARRVLKEIFPANDLDALREVVSDQFVNHEAPPGTPPGLTGIAMFMGLLNRAFSDQRWEIHDVLAEGDEVALRCTPQRCAHRGLLRRPRQRSPVCLQPDSHRADHGWQSHRALGRP